MKSVHCRTQRRRGSIFIGLIPCSAAILPALLVSSQRVQQSALILQQTMWSLRQIDLEAQASQLDLEATAYADLKIPPELADVKSPKLDELQKKGETAKKELRNVLEKMKADPPPDGLLHMPGLSNEEKAELKKLRAEWEASINERLAKLDAATTRPATQPATKPNAK